MNAQFFIMFGLTTAIAIAVIILLNKVISRDDLDFNLLSKGIVQYDLTNKNFIINNQLENFEVGTYDEEEFLSHASNMSAEHIKTFAKRTSETKELKVKEFRFNFENGSNYFVEPFRYKDDKIYFSFVKKSLVRRVSKRTENKSVRFLPKNEFRREVGLNALKQIHSDKNPALIHFKISGGKRIEKKYSKLVLLEIKMKLVNRLTKASRKIMVTAGRTGFDYFAYVPHCNNGMLECAKKLLGKVSKPFIIDGVALSVVLSTSVIEVRDDDIIRFEKKLIILEKKLKDNQQIKVYDDSAHSKFYNNYQTISKQVIGVIRESAVRFNWMPIVDMKTEKANEYVISNEPAYDVFSDINELRWYTEELEMLKEFEKMNIRKLVDLIHSNDRFKNIKMHLLITSFWMKKDGNIRIPGEMAGNINLGLIDWFNLDQITLNNIIASITSQGVKVTLPNVNDIYNAKMAIKQNPDTIALNAEYTKKLLHEVEVAEEFKMISERCKINDINLIAVVEEATQELMDIIARIGIDNVIISAAEETKVPTMNVSKDITDMIGKANEYIF